MGKYSIQLHIYCSNTTAESVLYGMGPAPYMATELFASPPLNCSIANLQIVKKYHIQAGWNHMFYSTKNSI